MRGRLPRMIQVKTLAVVRWAIPLSLLVVAACGGHKTEPATSPSASADTPPTETSEPVRGDDDASASAVDSTSSSEPASTSTPAASSDAPSDDPAVGEAKDECTPVGVDFEKRARPKVKVCYAEGKKKDPNLEGTVKIRISVGSTGKIKSTKIIEKTLPNPVAECMLKAIKETPFPEVEKCWNATLTIPITFPTPR